MKTPRTLFLTICFLILGITNGWAASSVLYGATETEDSKGIQVTAEVTAHIDGTVDDTYLSDSTNKKLTFFKGYRLSTVRVFFGSPAPLENSDLELIDSFNGVDALGGAGLNTIDNATNSSFLPLIGSTQYEVPVYGPLKLHVTGNNVNGAKFRIVFSFVPFGR
jgi:hypothetical protein